MSSGAFTKLRVGCIAEIPLGREMAHAINAFKTSGGFRRLGHDVFLYCLAPERGTVEQALAMYGEEGLHVRTIAPGNGPDAGPGSDGFADEFARLAVEAAGQDGCDVLYGRNFHAGLHGPRHGYPTAIETHAHVGDERALLDEVFAATRDESAPLNAVITIAPALRDHYIGRGADPSRVVLAPDAADPAMFARRDGGEDPLAEFSRPRVVYSGHLYDYKGIPTVLEAARRTPDLQWVLVGGTRADIQRVSDAAAGLKNVHLAGRKPHAEVPRYLWNSEALVLPPEPDHPSALWTSPVKLAEYLWAGRPILASGIQGLRNWIDEPAVTWFTPGDGAALAEAARRAVEESAEARTARAEAQRRYAAQFTYENRARIILDAALGRGTQGRDDYAPSAASSRSRA